MEIDFFGRGSDESNESDINPEIIKKILSKRPEVQRSYEEMNNLLGESISNSKQFPPIKPFSISFLKNLMDKDIFDQYMLDIADNNIELKNVLNNSELSLEDRNIQFAALMMRAASHVATIFDVVYEPKTEKEKELIAIIMSYESAFFNICVIMNMVVSFALEIKFGDIERLAREQSDLNMKVDASGSVLMNRGEIDNIISILGDFISLLGIFYNSVTMSMGQTKEQHEIHNMLMKKFNDKMKEDDNAES